MNKILTHFYVNWFHADARQKICSDALQCRQSHFVMSGLLLMQRSNISSPLSRRSTTDLSGLGTNLALSRYVGRHIGAGGKRMSPTELVALYRLHAAQCTDLAQRLPGSRLVLLHMARSWLQLAGIAEKNSQTTLVYETSEPGQQVAQQQQQPQPSNPEKKG